MNILKFVLMAAVLMALGLGAGWVTRALMEPGGKSSEVLIIDRTVPGIPVDDEPIMLSLSTCPVCKTARQWLKDHDIAYREMVVDTSTEAKRVADQLGLDSVPVFLIGNKQITGFEPALLESMLDANAGN